MVSVIVFSKDRPLQLHGYLEGLMYFSGIDSSNITVLYNKSSNIQYTECRKSFPEVNWIREENFCKDLFNIILKSEDYIMFGCDDVVFRRKVDFNRGIGCLSRDNCVFGYSYRLGDNIPHKDVVFEKKTNYIKWKWRESKCNHYNYPFELTATLYRKIDILNLISNRKKDIKNPNTLEEVGTMSYEMIDKPFLATNYGESEAIIITINRVQDEFLNEIDNKMNYTVERLYQMYKSGLRMDVKRIAKKKTSRVHVNSSYMIFKGENIALNTIKLAGHYTHNLLSNIKYLMKYNVEQEQNNRRDEAINHIVQKYELERKRDGEDEHI